MSKKPKYIQTYQLQKQINWEVLMELPRYAGGHDCQMKELFKGAEVIAHFNEGDYQGQVATCVKLEDGRFAIYNDYYGSCSGCDAWEDADDESVKRMCINLSNSTYVFKKLKDVVEFLQDCISEDEDREWNRWEGPAYSLLNEIKKYLTSNRELLIEKEKN